MAQHFAEMLVLLAIVGMILRNPNNFGTAIRGLSNAYGAFVGALSPGGTAR